MINFIKLCDYNVSLENKDNIILYISDDNSAPFNSSVPSELLPPSNIIDLYKSCIVNESLWNVFSEMYKNFLNSTVTMNYLKALIEVAELRDIVIVSNPISASKDYTKILYNQLKSIYDSVEFYEEE